MKTVKVILSLVLLILVIISTNVLIYPYNVENDNYHLEITIIIEGDVYTYECNVDKNFTFVNILNEYHHTVIRNGILYELDDIKTNFKDDYIMIMFNGKYSYYGIMDLPLCNECIYEFKVERVK